MQHKNDTSQHTAKTELKQSFNSSLLSGLAQTVWRWQQLLKILWRNTYRSLRFHTWLVQMARPWSSEFFCIYLHQAEIQPSYSHITSESQIWFMTVSAADTSHYLRALRKTPCKTKGVSSLQGSRTAVSSSNAVRISRYSISALLLKEPASS